MAGVRDRQLVRAGGWPRGVNNIARESGLPVDENGRRLALREAVNVDLDNAGVPSRRRGFESVGARTLAHSLWSDDLLPFGLLVDDGELHALHPDETVQPLGARAGTLPVSYALINQQVFWSNESACGVVLPDLSTAWWAPEQPAGQPSLELVPGLSLHAGLYQVAVTFTDRLGRESGCTLAAAIDVPEGHGIRAFSIPQPSAADVALVNVYLTDANDQVLRRHTSLPPTGITDINLGAPATGRALDTQFLQPMPPGQIVRLFNGMQLVATGNILRWSSPLRYGMHDPARGQMRFSDRIDLVAPAVDRSGVFVAAGARTYWLGGATPAEWSQTIVYGAGAVPGSHLDVPGTVFGGEATAPVATWLATDGQVVVGAGGMVRPTKPGEAAIDNADRAAPLLREEGGLRQLVMALRAPQRQGLAVRDEAVAHVIRRA